MQAQPHLPANPVIGDSRKWVKYGVLAALILVAVFASYLAYRWSMAPEGGHLSGSVRTKGMVRTEYHTRLNQSVSPACGAFLETADWRGASFVSTRLSFAVDSKWGIFHFVSPFPTYTDFSASLSYSATVIKFLAEETQTGLKSTVNMNSLVDTEIPKSDAITFARSYEDVDKIMLHGPSEIFIEQYGPVPFGAWNPVEDVPLNVVSENESFTVTEGFKGSRTINEVNDAGATVFAADPYRNNPVLDLIGKPILVWTAQPDADVIVDSETLRGEIVTKTNKKQHEGRFREYVAIVLRPAFSMRIAAFGPTDADSTQLGQRFQCKPITDSRQAISIGAKRRWLCSCLLYTSDAADE